MKKIHKIYETHSLFYPAELKKISNLIQNIPNQVKALHRNMTSRWNKTLQLPVTRFSLRNHHQLVKISYQTSI